MCEPPIYNYNDDLELLILDDLLCLNQHNLYNITNTKPLAVFLTGKENEAPIHAYVCWLSPSVSLDKCPSIYISLDECSSMSLQMNVRLCFSR